MNLRPYAKISFPLGNWLRFRCGLKLRVTFRPKSLAIAAAGGRPLRSVGENADNLRQEQNNKLNFCGRKWPVWDPLLTPKIPPKKIMWVLFLRPFPGNEAYFLGEGTQNWLFWVGAKKFMLKHFMCFFGALKMLKRQIFSQAQPTCPSCGSGRYGFGVFGAQDSVLRNRGSVGTRHAFFSIASVSI